MKRVLVLHWSQSGQLRRLMESFVAPLAAAGHEVHRVELVPVEPFPFPWSVARFFGLHPETVLERPRPIHPVDLPPGEWDLVVLAGQVWFLSPSMPLCAFLKGPQAGVLRGRRVLVLLGVRNMWVRGFRRIVTLVEAAGGIVTDRVVGIAAGPVFASYFSTLFWMLTGRKKTAALPEAGLGAETFARVAAHGEVVAERLAHEAPMAPLLAGIPTAPISLNHAFGEQIMGILFSAIALVLGTLTRPGSTLRALSAWMLMAFIVGSVLVLLPPTILLRLLLRRWVDPWVESLATLTPPTG